MRPHVVAYKKTKQHRCPKCGKMINAQMVRCKGCGQAASRPNRQKKKRKPFRQK